MIEKEKKGPAQPASIDLTKIRNIEAVKKAEPEASPVLDSISKSKGRGKFNFAQPELIQLPSRGILYKENTKDTDVLKGFIKMYPMTIKEEEILSTPRFLKTGSTTRMILDSCIASDIDAKDILLFDSNYLLFYLRKISYGDEYKFEINCANTTCERKFDHTVIISSLTFEELPETIIEPIVVKLPMTGYVVKAMLPRLYHSEDLYMRDSSRKKATHEESRRLVDNLIVTTLQIQDPNGREVPKNDWEEFFTSLPGGDAGVLREKTTFTTGVDTLENLQCPYCSTDYSGTIPIGPEFFRF
jgi:hypothetical protein